MAERGELPMDMIQSIFDRLTLFPDMVRFGAVCKSWWSVYAQSPHHVALQLPGLLKPGDGNLFTLNDSKITRWNKIPEEEHLIVGAFEGWLIVIDKLLGCSVLNPFSSDSKISLPSFTTLPDIVDVRCTEGTIEFTELYRNFLGEFNTIVLHSDKLFNLYNVIKVVLSSNPACSSDFIAIAIVGQIGDLVFCKPGDLKWTPLNTDNSYDDVIYYQDKFYAVSYSGETIVYDIGPPASETVVYDIGPPASETGLHIADRRMYLVESDGELLWVSRKLVFGEELSYITGGFEIFKLDTSRQSWSPVKSLGNRMLFLGLNCSLSASTSDFSGCKGNHIYFNDDTYNGSDNPWIGYDFGVFNIEDGTFQRHFESDSKKIWRRPVWITHMPQYKRATN